MLERESKQHTHHFPNHRWLWLFSDEKLARASYSAGKKIAISASLPGAIENREKKLKRDQREYKFHESRREFDIYHKPLGLSRSWRKTGGMKLEARSFTICSILQVISNLKKLCARLLADCLLFWRKTLGFHLTSFHVCCTIKSYFKIRWSQFGWAMWKFQEDCIGSFLAWKVHRIWFWFAVISHFK